MVIAYRDSLNDGHGWKRDLDEAKSDFDSILRRNTHWVSAELYFNGTKIKNLTKKGTKR
jgi:hypothetical protein